MRPSRIGPVMVPMRSTKRKMPTVVAWPTSRTTSSQRSLTSVICGDTPMACAMPRQNDCECGTGRVFDKERNHDGDGSGIAADHHETRAAAHPVSKRRHDRCYQHDRKPIGHHHAAGDRLAVAEALQIERHRIVQEARERDLGRDRRQERNDRKLLVLEQRLEIRQGQSSSSARPGPATTSVRRKRRT